jgi:KaiC/GvpD/RAD55 family RecA-like ATPase
MSGIQIIKNKTPKLSIPEFNCDGGLATHLCEYEMTRVCLNSFATTVLIGKPGSGKTSLLISWLTAKGKNKIFRKVFDNIIVVMPQSSCESMRKNPFAKHPEEKLYEELTSDSIHSIYEQLLAFASQDEKTLLILDDVGAALKQNDIQTKMRQIMFNRRHLKVHIVVMVQSYTSIPKELRKQISTVIMFKPSKEEALLLFDELFETKKDLALDIMKHVYRSPHDYLVLNVASQKMFSGFDSIILPTKE